MSTTVGPDPLRRDLPQGRQSPLLRDACSSTTRSAPSSRLPGARIERMHGRLLAWPGEAAHDALVRALERVFGVVVAVAGARGARATLDAISAAAVELTRAESRAHRRASRRSRSSRAAPTSAFRRARWSLARIVGAAVVAGARPAGRTCTRPSFTVGVEVGFEQAFVFAERHAGAGRPARRRHRPRRAAALGRHRLAGRRLDDDEARLHARRDLLPLVPRTPARRRRTR